MRSGVVSSKFIFSQRRLDGSFHLSEGLSVRKSIESSPYGVIFISDVTKDVYCPGIFRRNYVSSGIPFLGGGDIQKLELDSGKYLRESTTPNHDILQVKYGWSLVTCGGTIGDVVFATNLHASCWASQHVMRVIPNERIKEGMLYAYLACRYGKLLLTTDTYGSVIPTLNASNIRNIPIPSFPEDFQRKVDSLIKESAELREKGFHLREKAISYLDSKYPFDGSTKKVFSRGIHNLRLGWAAFNNNVEVDSIVSSYISNSFVLSEQTEKVFAPPLFKHIYLSYDNGYPFMTGSELTRFNMRFYRWLSPRGVKDINEYVVEEGTLLLYKSGTTDGGILGNVFIVDKTLDGCCLSDHVIRIKFKDKHMAFWTYAFLKTRAGVRVLQSLATGTMIPFITPERVEKIPIPSPDDKFDEIVSEVEEYISLTSEAKRKETEAISLVESEIEKWN